MRTLTPEAERERCASICEQFARECAEESAKHRAAGELEAAEECAIRELVASQLAVEIRR